jgi:hypothetical protein
MQFTPNAMVQDAIDNQSGIFNVMVKFNSEASGSNNVPQFSSLESITAAQRPKLTIEYTLPTSDNAIKPWCNRKGAGNEKSICALPYNSMQPF